MSVMLIAQLSDPHIRPPACKAYGCIDTARLLRQAVAKIGAMERSPDVVLITGDLTDCGLVEEYVHLRELLSGLSAPVFMVPGNHDRRENLRAVFADQCPELDLPGHMHYVVDRFVVRLIALDSVVDGQPHGELGSQCLGWLDERLADDPQRPTVLFMHHPPFRTGFAAMDRIGCRDGGQLGALVQRYPQVERVLCGHVHRAIQMPWCGSLACVGPSTAHQMALDLGSGRPEQFCLEPPGFLVHLWQGADGMVTHTCVTGDFPGPYDITLDPDYPAYQSQGVQSRRPSGERA